MGVTLSRTRALEEEVAALRRENAELREQLSVERLARVQAEAKAERTEAVAAVREESGQRLNAAIGVGLSACAISNTKLPPWMQQFVEGVLVSSLGAPRLAAPAVPPPPPPPPTDAACIVNPNTTPIANPSSSQPPPSPRTE